MDDMKTLLSGLYAVPDSIFEEDSLILALDFGTTFSGIAYAFTNAPDRIYTVDSWPGADDRIVPKTPTILQYESGSSSKFKWGYELEHDLQEKIIGLKLLLDPDQKRPYWLQTDPHAEIAKLPKPVVEVAADYIKAIFEHALREIEKGYLPGFIAGFEKQYILTVPAVWSDEAKFMTERAARLAGISPVSMITEPEAAALFTLQSMKDKGLQDGDAIVVCDAGGGTVDLIAYEIISLYPFAVKALTIPSGGAHGSLMLNESFEKQVKSVIGEETFYSFKTTEAYRNALREFDLAHKLAFRGPEDADRYVSFPMAKLKDNAAKGLVKNCLTLSGQTMFRIFDPIIQEIDRLVTEQVKNVQIERLESNHAGGSSVKAIFLVGGFGASIYLKERIQTAVPKSLVIQPRDAWSAIVKGAVMSKLPLGASLPTVISTKATKHYGTMYRTEWDPIRDNGRPKERDVFHKSDRCSVMQWYIYKGDELIRGEKNAYSFSQKFAGHDLDPADLTMTYELIESKAVVAPVHYKKDYKVNCTLATDLSEVPASLFVEKTSDTGRPYTRIYFRLLVENLPSGLMKFSIEVDGKEYAAVEATY